MKAKTSAKESTFAGRFVLERELGRGGMGVVYAAFDRRMKRNVALKVIARKFAANPEFAERFQRECEAVAQLDHENIVRVYDANVTPEGRWYLVMELLDGHNLRVKLGMQRGRRLPLAQGAYVIIQVLDAIRAAHDRGILHRDIKPENVFIGRGLHARLLDFGLAKAAEASSVTDENKQMGTYRYMAPEIVRGRRPDRRADLYSIGCVLFEVLTGRLPYDVLNDRDARVTEIQAAHVFGEVTPLRELLPGSPEAAQRILTKLLAKEPADRFATAKHARDEIHALLCAQVAPTDPMAIHSARRLTEVSDDWEHAADLEPRQEVAPRPARVETAELGASFAPSDKSPSWLRQPAAPASREAFASTAPMAQSSQARATQERRGGAAELGSITANGTMRITVAPTVRAAAAIPADTEPLRAAAPAAQGVTERTSAPPSAPSRQITERMSAPPALPESATVSEPAAVSLAQRPLGGGTPGERASWVPARRGAWLGGAVVGAAVASACALGVWRLRSATNAPAETPSAAVTAPVSAAPSLPVTASASAEPLAVASPSASASAASSATASAPPVTSAAASAPPVTSAPRSTKSAVAAPRVTKPKEPPTTLDRWKGKAGAKATTTAAPAPAPPPRSALPFGKEE